MISNPSELLQSLKTYIANPAIHYTDMADAVYQYRVKTSLSERTISAHTGISKTEVHRLLEIARLSPELKSASKQYNVEKYVLVRIAEENKSIQERLEDSVILGHITTVKKLRFFLRRI